MFRIRTVNALLRAAAGCAAALAATAGAQTIGFDFDTAPYRAPLPLDLTQGGVTVHCSATGQGYSIQSASTLGFTPAGFAGYAIYPSSVYASDLLLAFDHPLSDFSLMFAPEEYACDSSATLSVTAYRGSTPVTSASATAPVPGTWPTGVLTLHSAAPFDNVVVHYAAPPPTGGDWGPIFMADNLLITVHDAIFANGFE